MALVRWTFYDPTVPETYTFAINPNDGGDTSIDTPLGYQVTVAPDGAPIFYATQSKPQEISWHGTFLNTTDRDAMKHWANKHSQIRLTNDIGEQTWIWIDKLTITRKRVASLAYKGEYDLHGFVLNVT